MPRWDRKHFHRRLKHIQIYTYTQRWALIHAYTPREAPMSSGQWCQEGDTSGSPGQREQDRFGRWKMGDMRAGVGGNWGLGECGGLVPGLQHHLGAFPAGEGGKGIVSCSKRKPKIKRSGLYPKANALTWEERESTTRKGKKKSACRNVFRVFENLTGHDLFQKHRQSPAILHR